MLPPALVQSINEDHRTTDAVLRSDPKPKKEMFSHRDDVSLRTLWAIRCAVATRSSGSSRASHLRSVRGSLTVRMNRRVRD